MRRRWKQGVGRWTLTLLVIGTAFAAQAIRAQAQLLDGKVFSVVDGEAGKPASLDNVLTFKDGKFHSKACERWGYGEGEVKAYREGDVIRFETETRSEKYPGRQVWKGIVRGDAIEGTRVLYSKPSWYRPNPQPAEGWFKGALSPN